MAVPTTWSAVDGVFVPTPTRLFAASTNNVPESTFRLPPDAVKVPVVVMAVAVTEPVAVMVVAVMEPALSTLKFPAFTVTEPISIDFDDILSALARSLPVIEPSVMVELLTEFALTDEAEMLVNPEPFPENPVAVTVPMTWSAVDGVLVPIPTFPSFFAHTNQGTAGSYNKRGQTTAILVCIHTWGHGHRVPAKFARAFLQYREVFA